MDPQPPDDAATTLPRRTTPTWEMEVLLSGATVFALWQLAGAMAPATAYLLPRLPPQLAEIGAVVYLYLAAGVIMLGLAFGLHLAMRAYWVALVGMHSVFPGGLRMEGIKAGPVARDLLAERWPDPATAIERADNRATVVFGLGIGVAIVLVPVTVAVISLYSLVAAVCWALGRLDAIGWAFPAVAGLLFLPYLLAFYGDRLLHRRMRRGGALYRLCHATLSVYARLGMTREGNPLVTLYSSNVGDRRGTVVVLSIMLVTTVLASASLISQRMDLGPGGFGGFPEPWRGMPGTLDGRHYASLQEPDATPALPFLPAEQARGDYLRLVVPYSPGRHARALGACDGPAKEAADAAREQAAAGRKKTAAERAGREARLRCYAANFSLTLDGESLALQPDWYMDPARDLRGLIYMVPVAGLAAGRHELEIAGPDPRRPGSDEELPLPDRIPFWR